MKYWTLKANIKNIMKYIDNLVIFRTRQDYFVASVLTKADHHNLCGENHRRDSDK